MRGEAESWNQSAHGARGRTGTGWRASLRRGRDLVRRLLPLDIGGVGHAGLLR